METDYYFFKYCKEEVISKFKNISFHLSNIYNDLNLDNKLEFDYKDLFIKSNENNLIISK